MKYFNSWESTVFYRLPNSNNVESHVYVQIASVVLIRT